MLRVAGLFAGIGGLEMGLDSAGFHPALLCEIDPAATSVLKHRFPGVRLSADVHDLKRLPADVSLVCAGFPCQNLSSSGLKDGISGGQSSLVHHVFRLLERRPVDWVMIENVPFMLRLQRGEAINSIVGKLESLGYSWAYRVIDTQAFGIPHRRKRVYVVASRSGDPRRVLLAGDNPGFTASPPGRRWPFTKPIGFYWTEGTYATGLAYDAVPPLKGGSTIGIPSPPAALFPNRTVATPEIRDAERLQGFPADWTIAAERVGKRSSRWRLVGNAVSTFVARWIGEGIMRPREYDWTCDEELATASSWPDAAWGANGKRYVAPVSHFPVHRRPIGLVEFLRFPTAPLSVKATLGFLSRASKGNLRYPRGFIEALDRHARSAATVPVGGHGTRPLD